MSSSSKAFMRFQRNFTPGLIGLPVEDHDRYYKNLEQQTIDTSDCEPWGTFSGKHLENFTPATQEEKDAWAAKQLVKKNQPKV